jgi:hypothetical protein
MQRKETRVDDEKLNQCNFVMTMTLMMMVVMMVMMKSKEREQD